MARFSERTGDDASTSHGPDRPTREDASPSHDADQPTLPLDLDPHDPVPYRLTAKAVRAVAPGSLPALRVVRDVDGGDGGEVPSDLDDPHDPRSARARALRRAGVPVGDIARELDVDEVVVRSWISGVGRPRRRLRAVPVRSRPSSGPPPPDPGAAELGRRFADARAGAALEAPGRLDSADFTRGLALAVAAAEIDRHGLVVTVRDRTVAATVVRWLRQHAGADVGDLRVVLRLGDVHGADLTAHRWAEDLGIPPTRMARTRWDAAPAPEAVEALIRVVGPEVAGRVAGWRDVLLGTPDLDHDGHDLAF